MLDFPIIDMLKDAQPFVNKPEKFQYDKWVEWQESVKTYLKGVLNITKDIPLIYVIRPDQPPDDPTEDEQIIHHAPLAGSGFKLDNETVHRLLTELTSGTDAASWLKQHQRTQNGRGAWKTLSDHYDGRAEGDRRIVVAHHTLNTIFTPINPI